MTFLLAFVLLGPGVCERCHEIQPQVESWRTSTHRNIDCTECHEYSTMKNIQRAIAHSKGEIPERPHIGNKDVAALVERCGKCHQQQYAEWKAGPHSATYARIFTNAEHNRKRKPMDDCLRCHGMFFEGEIRDVLTPEGTLREASMNNAPTMPCMTCHTMHRFGEPSAKPAERAGTRQRITRPSLALFDRRSRMSIAADMLPVPAMLDGTRPVKMSPDARQGLCYQCHAALATRIAFSGDDRTASGVHEGLSCFACHQGHQQNTRASCATCHPRLSNCGIDVEKMDTTFLNAKSRHNIHNVKCADCHPSGIPRRTRSSIR